ncbi:MAG: lipid A-modifier LpxR family protein, partial [Bacteroidota bacterium]
RSFAVAQAIYTPSRYQMETPYDWEHPYAGNLFGEYLSWGCIAYRQMAIYSIGNNCEYSLTKDEFVNK